MKKIGMKIFSIIFLTLSLASCGKNDTYDQSMQKAKEAIIERKFEQADGFVEMALESRPNEEEAKKYQKQIKLYSEALTLKEKKEIDGAISKLDEVIEVKKGSEKLIEYAKKEKNDLETQKDEPKKDDSKKESGEKEESNDLWNSSKADNLKRFMSDFSQTMGQDYKEYSQSKDVDLYGIKLPSEVLKDKWKMAVNNQPVQLEWSKTGKGKSQYQLVAVYSDAETQPNMEKHVYFFIIEEGHPKVMVTQQNQGNEESYLHFKESQNVDLNDSFQSIVEGKEVVKKETSTQSSGISSFPEAKDFVLNHKASWTYGLEDKNESNIEVISVNENHQEISEDDNGSYYMIVVSTDDDDGSITGGGKQFKVYTDEKLFQRVGMHGFDQIYP
ncbi:DUF4767 domain-containing protein [Vagococcus carniphilus]|uniref:DUF4767 domain-containing protein n=1 Tax=Vagococcus carniphilus TaxID=218144 RepID=A0A430B661_9ENTE|nr:DUF4767 domain-containing protein [Vagococcus carniphilus]QNN72680.1 DUF4767 domain-containing protein [Vagococcus carniphilus]RSU15786.1 hypothetical protein CBF28_04950 [Vagococcus carniphilus]